MNEERQIESAVASPGVHLAFLEDMLDKNVGRIFAGRVVPAGYSWHDAPVNEQREMVDHPRHYNAHPSGVECIDICEHMTFNLGNAFKYGWRYAEKGDPVENLKKMLWYLRRADEHDTPFLFRYTDHFRSIMQGKRAVFSRPSPWCEPIRHALAFICDMHCSPEIAERSRLIVTIMRCVETAIADEQCLGRGQEP